MLPGLDFRSKLDLPNLPYFPFYRMSKNIFTSSPGGPSSLNCHRTHFDRISRSWSVVPTVLTYTLNFYILSFILTPFLPVYIHLLEVHALLYDLLLTWVLPLNKRTHLI